MKINPFAGFLLFVGGVLAACYIFKPRKISSSGSTSKTLTQAEADAIAKEYQDFMNSGNAETTQFPTGSQKLMIKLNEAGYRLDVSVIIKTPPRTPISDFNANEYTAKAIYVGGIVHQLTGYKYSDGFTKEKTKTATITFS